MRHKQHIETIGTKQFQRFRIRDNDQGFWTGDSWSPASHEAALFLTLEDSARELKVIQMVERIDQPIKEFEAKVTVRVLGDAAVDEEELSGYLAKAARLTIHSARDEESVVHCQIDWGTLQPTPDHSEE